MSNETFKSHTLMEEEWNTMMDNRDRIDASGTPDKALKCPKCNWRFEHPKTLVIRMTEKHCEKEETILGL